MRLCRSPKACSRTNGRKRSTRRAGPPVRRSRLGELRKEFFDHAGMAAEHRDRQIAKTHVLGQHGQQRFDDARAEAVADDHAVDVAGIERARRALDAERADEADPLADRNRKLRIVAAAAGDQNRRFIERIVGRHFRHAARRGRKASPCGASTVPCSARMRARGAEPANDPRRRHVCGNRQRMRHRRGAVLVHAGDDRRERAAGGVEPTWSARGHIHRRVRDRRTVRPAPPLPVRPKRWRQRRPASWFR